MSTVEKCIRLYAWKTNYQTIQVVQGEIDSRTFRIQLFNTSSPLDISDCRVLFYAVKPDMTKVYVDCEVIDFENGLISVTVSEQMCAVRGTADCWIQVLGVENTDLRFDGLTLEVIPCEIKVSLTESNDEIKAFLEQSLKLAQLQTEVEKARGGMNSLQHKEQAQDDLIEQAHERIDSILESLKRKDAVLWSGVLDTLNSPVTLSDNVTNYDYIDVYIGQSNDKYARRFVAKNGTYVLTYFNIPDNDTVMDFMTMGELQISLQDNQLMILRNRAIRKFTGETEVIEDYGEQVTKIVGIKFGESSDQIASNDLDNMLKEVFNNG